MKYGRGPSGDNNLEEMMECSLKFAVDRVGCQYVWAAMQKDLGRLEKWPDRNFMQFNKDIQQVQQLGIKSPPSNTTGWG